VSAFVDALFTDLGPDDLRRLAELLEPYLTPTTDVGWLRGAKQIAQYLGCPESRVNSLVGHGELPVERDGRTYMMRRADLDKWVERGGGKRT
jgi:excisionase family DNA binding protein